MTFRLLSNNLIESDSDDNDYDPANEQMATDDDSGSENENANEAEMPENNHESENDEPMADDESEDNQPSTSRNNRPGRDEYMRGKPFMPMEKVRRYLENTYSGRVSRKTVAALIGVIQYLMIHLLMEAEAKMRSRKQRRISEQVISMAIQENEQLSHLLANVNIPKSGVYGIIGHQPGLISRHPRRSRSD